MAKRIFVLIAAAGTGSRMGLKINKQFLEIAGVPAIIRTAKLFDSLPEISGLGIIAAETDMAAMRTIFNSSRLKVEPIIIAGGPTRQHSVLNGLRAISEQLKPEHDDIILVHDGARCLITADVVRRCIDGINRHSCACGAATLVKDTIKQTRTDQDSSEPYVESTLDRSRLWAMQTPQGAPFGQLLDAYETVTARNQLVTDDLAVMEAAGHLTRLTIGDYSNLKITTPEDIRLAESFLL